MRHLTIIILCGQVSRWLSEQRRIAVVNIRRDASLCPKPFVADSISLTKVYHPWYCIFVMINMTRKVTGLRWRNSVNQRPPFDTCCHIRDHQRVNELVWKFQVSCRNAIGKHFGKEMAVRRNGAQRIREGMPKTVPAAARFPTYGYCSYTPGTNSDHFVAILCISPTVPIYGGPTG